MRRSRTSSSISSPTAITTGAARGPLCAPRDSVSEHGLHQLPDREPAVRGSWRRRPWASHDVHPVGPPRICRSAKVATTRGSDSSRGGGARSPHGTDPVRPAGARAPNRERGHVHPICGSRSFPPPPPPRRLQRLERAAFDATASHGDPQDPACRHHHAGEPLVRQLLRHFPRRRRHPDAEWGAGGVRCRTPSSAAVCGLTTTRRMRTMAGPTAYTPPPATSTAGGWTGSSPRPSRAWAPTCNAPGKPPCPPTGPTDVMGYHDQREIPNYWTYARNFVLQDHMFEPNASWSLPAHLFMVSEWSAMCSQVDNPMSCTSDIDKPQSLGPSGTGGTTQLRLDRPHLPAAQAQRELEVLCGGRHRARLR